MNAILMNKIAESVVESVKAYVEAREVALLKRIDELMAAIPVKNGLDGKDGRDGTDGKDGEPGKDGRDGTDGVNGLSGKDGTPGKDGETGPAGKDGRDGIDGKDGADGLNGKDGAPGIDGKAGSQGEPGTDGKDGINGKDGRDGVDGKNGADGLSIKGDTGSPGLDGRDGMPGANGTSGVNGKDGLDGFSLDDFRIEKLEDGRTLRFKLESPQRTIVKDIRFDVPIYRGTFNRGSVSEKDDMVTHHNEVWIALVDKATEAPGMDSKQWKLAIRKGRDGKPIKIIETP